MYNRDSIVPNNIRQKGVVDNDDNDDGNDHRSEIMDDLSYGWKGGEGRGERWRQYLIERD